MKAGIKAYLTRAVYLLLAVHGVYLAILVGVFLYITHVSGTIDEQNLREKQYFVVTDNLMEIESTFLNHQAGHIPTPGRIFVLLGDIGRQLDALQQEHTSDSLQDNAYFLNLQRYYLALNANLNSYFKDSLSDSEKQVLEKQINESFFVHRLLTAKHRAMMDEQSAAHTRRINKMFTYYLLSISILFVIVGWIVVAAKRLNAFIMNKIMFLVNSIQHISEESVASGSAHIAYQDRDEFVQVIDTFNQMIDVISRQHSQLAQSEAQLKYLYDNHPDALLLLNEKLEITTCNQTALQLFSFTALSDFAKHRHTLSPEYQPDGMLSGEKANQYVQPALNGTAQAFEWVFQKRDGSTFLAQVMLSRIELNGTLVVQESIRDITQSKREEERLIQSQKMDSIGTLAGGIAHDFNNILSGIVGSLSMLQFRLEERVIDPDEFRKYLDIMEHSSERAKNIVNQLLMLSRRQEPSLKKMDVLDVLRNVKTLAEHTVDKLVLLNFQLPERPCYVWGDATQLEQVFLNLAINASHAMTIMRKNDSWGGTLDVTVEASFTAEEFAAAQSEPKLYWRVDVKDSGVGMTKEVADEIFTPFFTTKDKGTGTGLGLAMVYTIIKQHGGFVSVYSEPGTGTTFRTFLPAYRSTGDDLPVEEMVNGTPVYGEGLILVVDDELVMRTMARDLLVICGYEVLLAEDGAEAVRLFEARQEDIALVLLDIVMPNMGGHEAFMKMRALSPHVNVLVSSGFQNDDRVQALMKQGANGFLQKPYSLGELSRTVAAILHP